MTDPAFDHPRRWVHLPVEVKIRELQSRILLACVAAERGFGAVVGLKHRVAGLAGELPRGIYVEKSIQLPALAGIRTRRSLGHVECCLDEEGVVYIDADDYTAARLARPCLDRMERFFTWGAAQAQVLQEFHPAVASRLRITGNPRVDLWRPELREFFRAPAEQIAATHGDFVLVTTAFAMVNNDRGSDYFLEVVAENGGLEADDARARMEGYLAYSAKIFELMRQAVLDLARKRPEITFVVRPHPSERAAPWEELGERTKNVVVVREGALTPWLLAANVVVHNNSTSGLEAALIGRPTVAFVPLTDERYDQNLPNKVCALAPDVEALLDHVDAAFRGAPLAMVQDAAVTVEQHIAALDGPWASDRLVDAMLDLACPRLPLSNSRWRALRAFLATAPRRVASKVERSRSPRDESPVGGVKFTGSSLAEVRSVVDRLREVSGRFAGVTCIEHAPDVYAFVDPQATPV